MEQILITHRELWIAFNLVSLHLQKQLQLVDKTKEAVVNCFQFSIFAFAKTTFYKSQEQKIGCELLSI